MVATNARLGALELLRAVAEGEPGRCLAAFYGGEGERGGGEDDMGGATRAVAIAAGLEGARILVPWVVLTELDGLKAGSGRAGFLAREAARFLDEAFALGRVDGQTMVRARAADLEHGDGSGTACPDDRVLQCALQERGEGVAVVLLTSDAVLRAKATFHGLRAEPPPPCPEKLAALLEDVRQATALTPSSSGPLAVSGGSVSRPAGPPGREASPGAVPVPVLVAGTERDGAAPPRDWEGYAVAGLDAVATAGGAFCKERFVECFGQETWEDVICCRPPWASPEVLRILCKHWISVFQEVLPRRVRNLVEQLAKAEKALSETASDEVPEHQALHVLNLSLQLIRAFGQSPTPTRACRGACSAAEAELEALLQQASDRTPGSPLNQQRSSPSSPALARGGCLATESFGEQAASLPFRPVDRASSGVSKQPGSAGGKAGGAAGEAAMDIDG